MATRLPSKEKIAGSNPVTRSQIMKFSIVIPCHNEEKTLPLLLDSINKLNYPRNNFEVIVIDNNCTDGTIEVTKKFQVDKIIKEKKQGLTWARQRGFLTASGEIICCVDADCQLPPDWLLIAQKYLNNPKIVAVSGPYDYMDIGYFFRKSSLIFQSIFYPIIPKIFYFLFCKPAGLIIGGNCLIKKSALQKIGGFDTSVNFWGEDTLTALRLAKIGQVIFAPSVKVFSSGRRFKKDGYFKTVSRYFLNYLWLYFFNKPFVKEKD